MILITQQTTLPRIVRGLAIELNPNRSGSTVTQVAGLIPLVTGETDCRGPLSECFIAYADLSSTDSRRNDTSSFLCEFADDTGGNLFVLQKQISGIWSDVESPFSSGTFYDYNTWDAYQVRAGIKIDWRTVLSTHGTGSFRLVVNNELFSYPIILKEFGCSKVAETVKFEIEFDKSFGRIDGKGYHSFVTGDNEIVWSEMARYIGGFGRVSGSHEYEKFEFRNEVLRTQKISSQMNFNIFIEGGEEVLNRFEFYGLTSDFIKVTEYNEDTGKYKTDYQIQLSGDTEREYIDYTDTSYRFTAEVERTVKNLGSRACI